MDMQTLGPEPIGNTNDADYDHYLERIQARYLQNVSLTAGAKPLFTTSAEHLFDIYLAALPDEQRQYHTCSACKDFIERYGGLVTITSDSRTRPVFWDDEDTPDLYKRAVEHLTHKIRHARVTGVFLSSEKIWGRPVTGIWKHFALTPHLTHVSKSLVQTAGQAMAEKLEDFKNIAAALDEFSLPIVKQAVILLGTDSLYRSEKVLGQAQWLLRLHVAWMAASSRGSARRNVIWDFVATAPTGFCHPKSSMIGTLLEDLATGAPYEAVARRWQEKMHPLQYQRPQAAPSEGTIRQAEKIMEQLKAAGSLRRRYASIEDLRHLLWIPATPKPQPKGEGVFGHLKTKETPDEGDPIRVPVQTMTWEKFARIVLPTAERIEWLVKARDNYTTLVTAVDPDAPPILQWDRADQRNPVSWYVWNGGSTTAEFNLGECRIVPVQAITYKPSMWYGGQEHQGRGVIFILEGAKDLRRGGGLALFPEILRSEFHGIRSVLEAYSKTAMMEPCETPAAGVMLHDKTAWPDVRLRVTSQGQTLTYKLDRWD